MDVQVTYTIRLRLDRAWDVLRFVLAAQTSTASNTKPITPNDRHPLHHR
jgi:hypothetical protein